MRKLILFFSFTMAPMPFVQSEANNVQQPAKLLQPQPPAVLPTQDTYPQVNVSQKPEDPNNGPALLRNFFMELLPGLAKMAMGTEYESPELQAQGIQQFSGGLANFAYLVTRSPKDLQKFLENPQALNNFFHEQELERPEETAALKKFVPRTATRTDV